MKKFVFLMILISCCIGMNAQKSKEEHRQTIRERREMLKLSEDAVQKKILKEVKKRVRDLQKEGWKEFPGEKPLGSQFEEQMQLSMLMDGNFPKYLMGTGNGISSDMQKADKAAQFNSKSDIAGQFETEIYYAIDMSVDETHHNGVVESMTRFLSETTKHVYQNLKNIKAAVKMYREKAGEYEVVVIMYTDFNQAKVLFLEQEKNNSQLRRILE